MLVSQVFAVLYDNPTNSAWRRRAVSEYETISGNNGRELLQLRIPTEHTRGAICTQWWRLGVDLTRFKKG